MPDVRVQVKICRVFLPLRDNLSQSQNQPQRAMTSMLYDVLRVIVLWRGHGREAKAVSVLPGMAADGVNGLYLVRSILQSHGGGST